MGYFGNAICFEEEPDIEVLATSVAKSAAIDVFKHKDSPLWLADVYSPTQRTHYPFSELMPIAGKSALDENAADIFLAYDSIVEITGNYSPSEIQSAMRWATSLSKMLSQSVFYFAADDEGIDFALLARDGGISILRSRLSSALVELQGDTLLVHPYKNDEFEPGEDLDELQEAEIDRLILARVVSPILIDGGFQIYGTVSEAWPFGDPEKLLGIGTFDPFDNVQSDYDVLERFRPTPKRPWWKIGGA